MGEIVKTRMGVYNSRDVYQVVLPISGRPRP
jgi:hypothetical protein